MAANICPWWNRAIGLRIKSCTRQRRKISDLVQVVLQLPLKIRNRLLVEGENARPPGSLGQFLRGETAAGDAVPAETLPAALDFSGLIAFESPKHAGALGKEFSRPINEGQMDTVTVDSIPIIVGREEDGRWWADIESMPGVMAMP
jgi:hypothetical protein